MSSSPPTKKAKTTNGNATEEYFPEVTKVEYKGTTTTVDDTTNGVVVQDGLYYRYYNPDEVLMGKPMKEWLKFSLAFWHTMRGEGKDPFGLGTPSLIRPWEGGREGDDPIAVAKRRIDVFFELLTKLQVEYYTFHDYDVAPEGSTMDESESNLDVITDYLSEKQAATGIKCLWVTQCLFVHPIYKHGGSSAPNVNVYCRAAAQTKKAMDAGHKLGAANHVFWGGREGYQTLLNTDLRQEAKQMSEFFKMVVAYKKSMGYQMQLLVEPKPREPCKHQYDYDAQTTLHFLHAFGLQDDFKLNLEPNHTTLAGHGPEHDIAVACAYDALGSIDSNTGDPMVGWDTDQFPMDVQQTTAIMSYVIQQPDGLGSGGLNFDAKVRRESCQPVDLVIAHVGGIDSYALGLRKAVEMHEAGTLSQMVKKRYETWSTTDIGPKVLNGEATLEECAKYAKDNEDKVTPEAIQESGQQELYEVIRNKHIYG